MADNALKHFQGKSIVGTTKSGSGGKVKSKKKK